MVAVLRRERPVDAVIGEELGRSGATESPRVWLLDPLCGTLNYFAGTRIVAINAALNTPDGVIAAAVADPFTSDVFWESAWESQHMCGRVSAMCWRGRGRDSGLVDFDLDPPFPNAPGFRAVLLAADEEFTSCFSPRVVSSSLALTWVATGQRAAYVTDGDIRASVDFAAGLAICEAAGCLGFDLDGDSWGRAAGGLIVAAWISKRTRPWSSSRKSNRAESDAYRAPSLRFAVRSGSGAPARARSFSQSGGRLSARGLVVTQPFGALGGSQSNRLVITSTTSDPGGEPGASTTRTPRHLPGDLPLPYAHGDEQERNPSGVLDPDHGRDLAASRRETPADCSFRNAAGRRTTARLDDAGMASPWPRTGARRSATTTAWPPRPTEASI